MENEKTLISRNNLAERWDFDSPNTIISYENDGVLTRNPNIKVPRYYMEEVLKIETLKEINPLSPLERRRLERKIEELEKEVSVLRDKLTNIKVLLG
ncbi:transcription factor [Clostridium sp. UBA5712]|uniref:transcription factor n=1 Tax=Clostridium sp. UBA5712 TaxID=1946368 RepID=UPI003217A1B9